MRLSPSGNQQTLRRFCQTYDWVVRLPDPPVVRNTRELRPKYLTNSQKTSRCGGVHKVSARLSLVVRIGGSDPVTVDKTASSHVSTLYLCRRANAVRNLGSFVALNDQSSDICCNGATSASRPRTHATSAVVADAKGSKVRIPATGATANTQASRSILRPRSTIFCIA